MLVVLKVTENSGLNKNFKHAKTTKLARYPCFFSSRSSKIKVLWVNFIFFFSSHFSVDAHLYFQGNKESSAG